MTNIPDPPKDGEPYVPNPPSKKMEYHEFAMRERGREPPTAVDLEMAVLGALLVDKKGLNVMPILKAKFFAIERHRVIFKAIEKLHNENQAVDLLTVSNQLEKMNKLSIVGDKHYLITLMQQIASSAHIDFHARIVIQKYVLRQIIVNSYTNIEKAIHSDPDIFHLLDDIELENTNLIKDAILTDESQVQTDAFAELYDKVQSVMAGKSPGIQTGLKEFDDWCGGFAKRELITVAARPGMGKTTAMLAIASKASIDSKIRGAFISIEMTTTDLKNRLAAKYLKIPYLNIRLGKLDYKQLNSCRMFYEKVDKSDLILIDKLSYYSQIVKRIRDLVIKKGVKYVMIDYVQLIKLRERRQDRTGEINDITRGLKALANELNIPIIILAQLSRKIDNRPNRRPIISDLKQSGSIEEDSDTVIFIFRNGYYIQESGQEITPDVAGKTEWIVAKGRNIGTKNFWTFLDFVNYDFLSL